MVLQAASIVFNDSASQFNKDLTDFLKRNLETAIRNGGLSFQFKITKPADLAGLRQMGIKRLPAMIINNKPFVGVPNIIAEIRSRVKNSKNIAPEKSEEEIVREYQIAALGNITKDNEGRLQVHDEPETDENDNLMSAFNREIQRRGATAGHNKDDQDDGDNPQPRMQRPPPPQPARTTDRDMGNDDDDDDGPPIRLPQRHQVPPQQQRVDNLNNPAMADAFESLKSISRNATKEDAQDDQMMAALLDRMSGEN